MKKLETLQDVLRAYMDGKEIVYKGKEMEEVYPTTGFTVTNKFMCIEMDRFYYYLKPQPKYRPWTPEEAFGYIGSKISKNGDILWIRSISRSDCLLTDHIDEVRRFVQFDKMLDFKFSNGKPCGTEV